jgi:hypothetical protein
MIVVCLCLVLLIFTILCLIIKSQNQKESSLLDMCSMLITEIVKKRFGDTYTVNTNDTLQVDSRFLRLTNDTGSEEVRVMCEWARDRYVVYATQTLSPPEKGVRMRRTMCFPIGTPDEIRYFLENFKIPM